MQPTLNIRLEPCFQSRVRLRGVVINMPKDVFTFTLHGINTFCSYKLNGLAFQLDLRLSANFDVSLSNVKLSDLQVGQICNPYLQIQDRVP